MTLPLSCIAVALAAVLATNDAVAADAAPPGGKRGAAASGSATASRAAPEGACAGLPPLPARPAKARSVDEFGARPDDDQDDTAAIQRALDALAPGEWLTFPRGRYLHSKSLRVKTRDVVLWGEGATLQATNPADQAIWIEADGASVYRFTLTAVTDKRRSAPWESRIAIFGGSKPSRELARNVIRGNRIVEGGAPGTPLANSSSSAAIFVYRATRFLVAENTVSRSLSDGIHVTSGSSHGRVLNNTVKETGDDMIAVVSYAGDRKTTAAQLAADYDARRARGLSHHIRIANNTVSGQYWGRGISVVGGEHVTIENNTIDRTVHGAAIYIARETGYVTFGVRNVLVRNNRITDVQTTDPVYAAGSHGPHPRRAGHGAIEIYSWLHDDEAEIDWLRDALGVHDVRIENNTIERARSDGVRIGTPPSRLPRPVVAQGGAPGDARDRTNGPVGRIELANNRFTGLGGQPIAINHEPAEAKHIACTANSVDGRPATNKRCSDRRVRVEGACA